ncbi:hypothetical protein JW877_07040 [bacterium]|nr:hypothetical protein [bacterium]
MNDRSRIKLWSWSLGFASLYSQVFLLRESIALLRSNELVVALFFFFWLVLYAAGSGIFSRFRNLGLVQVALAFSLPFSFFWIKLLGSILQVHPGRLWDFWRIILLLLLALVPFGILAGTFFGQLCRKARSSGLKASTVYIFEALGAVLGGILSLIMVARIPPVHSFIMIGTFLGIIWIFTARTPVKITSVILTSLLMLLAMNAQSLSGVMDKLYWKGYESQSYESRYGKILVLSRQGEQYLFENGSLVAATADTVYLESLVNLCLLAHPGPERVLLVGGIYEGAVGVALQHHPRSITYLEVDPRILEVTRPFFPKVERAMNEPRVDVEYSDARFWIKKSNRNFEVIMLLLPNPQSGFMNRFYTLEFFQEIKGRLDYDGIFAFQLNVGVNYISSEEQVMVNSVREALQNVFIHVRLVQMDNGLLFFASPRSPLELDPDLLNARLEERGIRNRYLNREVLAYFLDPFRQNNLESMLIKDAREKLIVNRDFSPIAYYIGLQEWFKLTGGGVLLKKLKLLRLEHWLIFFLTVFLLVKLLNRYIFNKNLGTIVLIIVGGLGGILTELIVLYLFQALFGYLYWLVGVLTSVFMLGLVTGANLTRNKERFIFFRLWSLLWIIFVLIMLFLFKWTSLYQRLGYISGTLCFMALQLIAGTLTGMLFPLGVRWFESRFPSTVNAGGIVFGLDSLGAAMGAVLTGIIFIPLMGITGSLILWLIILILAMPIWI